MTPISAVLITLNEEPRIADALRSVAFCEETLVVDAASSDRTVEIARDMGARVIVNAPWPGFVAQRALAVGAARHDWILALDADERVSPALRAEIERRRVRGFGHAGYRVPRVAYYLGAWVRATDWYPDGQLRLFDRRHAHYRPVSVHESVSLGSRAGRLRGEIEHFPYGGLSEHLQRIDRYTGLWVEDALATGRRTNPVEMLVAPSWALVRNLIVKQGFRLGRVGLMISVLNSFYTYAKLAKLEEACRGASPPPS